MPSSYLVFVFFFGVLAYLALERRVGRLSEQIERAVRELELAIAHGSDRGRESELEEQKKARRARAVEEFDRANRWWRRILRFIAWTIVVIIAAVVWIIWMAKW
jgi:hypothetical protein